MQPASFIERNWKRPTNIAPFPKIWHTFTTTDRKEGRTYKIRIQDMTVDQREEVWDMFVEHFYPDEELSRLLKAFEDPASMASQKLKFDDVIKENMTVVAVLDNDESLKSSIIGCLLLAVSSEADPPLPELPGISVAKFRNLFKLLRDDINVFEKLNAKHLLKEFGLVVKREYRRMNIATELFKTMERMGNVFHIPAAVVTLGNASSQALSTKIGFNLLKELNVSDYKDEEGHLVFPALDGKVIQYGYFKYTPSNEIYPSCT